MTDPSNPRPALLRLKDILAPRGPIPVSKSTWWAGVKSGRYPAPIKLGKLQDVSFDFSFTLKELRGQNQFPIDVRRGSGKLTGKAKFAELSGRALNDLFFSGTSATGTILPSSAGL